MQEPIVNTLLLGEQESFSLIKLLLGGMFFLIIIRFLFIGKSPHKHLHFDKSYRRPLASAFLLTLFFSSINRLIKTGQLHPFQSVFYTEGGIFVVATLVYLIKKRKRTKILPLKTRLLPTFFWAVCNVSGSVLAYLAYQQIAANSVHVVRLFGVMITALLARFFLKEKLTRQQFLWIGIALTALITFTLAK